MPISTPRWLGVAALLAALTGCMPSYYITLHPPAGAARWDNGQELVVAAADSVEVRMSVAATAPAYVEFFVTVRNTSARPVLVAPEQFFALVDFPATKNAPGGQLRIGAEDPELALHTLNQQTDHHDRKSTGVSALELLSTVNNVAQDLSSGKRKETEAEYNARKAAYASEMDGYEEKRYNHALQADRLRYQTQFLEETRLRKTTVEPGYALEGRVRFRAWSPGANHLRLVVPVAGRELTGDFVQTTYRMDGTQTTQLPTPAWQPTATAAPVR
jgi:hypothetical protein